MRTRGVRGRRQLFAAAAAVAIWTASPAHAQSVQVNTFAFEAGVEPSVPLAWQGKAVDGQEGLWIVSLAGPVYGPWGDAVARKGKILSYLPRYPEVVSAEPARIRELSAIRFVSHVQAVHPAYKVA